MFNFLKKSKERQPLLFNTDIHCHIVPGVDDGSPDLDTSLELLERMASWGLRTIITTPHITQDTFENTPETLNPPFEALKQAAAEKLPDVELKRSAEHRIDSFFLSELDRGVITPFPSNYILVENSFVTEPYGFDRLMFDLKQKGYRPIMAHPERFLYYQSDRDRYNQLRRTGQLFQVNLLSLAGYYGKPTKQMAEWLVEQEMVDFLGTDLHNHAHADAIEEYLTSKDYRRLTESSIRLMNDKVFKSRFDNLC